MSRTPYGSDITVSPALATGPAGDSVALAGPMLPSGPTAKAVDRYPTRPRLAAILIGLLGTAVIAALTDYNERFMHLPPLIGNHLPVGPIVLALIAQAAWNAMSWRRPSWRVRRSEAALILTAMLFASWIPGSGFYRYFHAQLALPQAISSAKADWRAAGTLSYMPSAALPRAESASARETVFNGALNGIRHGDQELDPREAPYLAWLPALAMWTPIVLALATAVVGLAILAHRQWTRHEQLVYPLAAVMTAFVQTDARGMPLLLRSRLFWMGFAPVVAIHAYNCVVAYFPASLPAIPLAWRMPEIDDVFPTLGHSGSWQIVNGRLYFVIIGIAYFIPSEASLSMGISAAVLVAASAQVYLATGTPPNDIDNQATLAGAYVAYAVVLCWIGRRYYADAIARGLWLRRSRLDDRSSEHGVRAAIVGTAATIALLVGGLHLDWPVAAIFVAGLLVFFAVFTRVICETGIPFLQGFDVGVAMSHMFGLPFLGPGATATLGWIGNILCADPRECLMPYAANSLKVSEDAGLGVGRMVAVGAAAIVLALGIGFVVQTYSVYNRGLYSDGYASGIAERAGDLGTRGLNELADAGLLPAAGAAHGLDKIPLLASNFGARRFYGWMAFGAAGVAIFSFLRFSWRAFPLHPVLFLVWGVWPAALSWPSFLLGWAVKEGVMRFGGGRTYQDLKPLFLGMILAELVALAALIVFGFAYHIATGLTPHYVPILPG